MFFGEFDTNFCFLFFDIFCPSKRKKNMAQSNSYRQMEHIFCLLQKKINKLSLLQKFILVI